MGFHRKTLLTMGLLLIFFLASVAAVTTEPFEGNNVCPACYHL
jgi:hypothetical protein